MGAFNVLRCPFIMRYGTLEHGSCIMTSFWALPFFVNQIRLIPIWQQHYIFKYSLQIFCSIADIWQHCRFFAALQIFCRIYLYSTISYVKYLQIADFLQHSKYFATASQIFCCMPDVLQSRKNFAALLQESQHHAHRHTIDHIWVIFSNDALNKGKRSID